MGCWYNVKGDKTPSCLWRHGMFCQSCVTNESHRRQNSIGEKQAYPSCSHTESTLNSFIQSAICSTSKSLLSSSHALIYCWIIKPNCFMHKEFVFTGYIVHFKGTTILSSIYFPSSYSVVPKPQWESESWSKFDSHGGGLGVCISNKHFLRKRWSTMAGARFIWSLLRIVVICKYLPQWGR